MLDTPAGPCQHHDPASSSVLPAQSTLARDAQSTLARDAQSTLARDAQSTLARDASASGRQPLRESLFCFARTMLVGFWANVLDFALLALCLRLLHIEALSSRVIALLVSGLLTFVGTRSFAFRVQGGNVPQQAGRFVIAELAALPLNLLSFQLCALFAPLAAPEVVSFVANGLVFVAFSYPVRRLLVFGAAAPSGLLS